MNDTELADRLVKLGIISHYNNTGTAHEREWPETIVRDWLVAGALMEKLRGSAMCPSEWYFMDTLWKVYVGADITIRNQSLPRAIIEACVEALS